MTIYSIDLAIDPDATGGHTGEEDDPYPMQISLCSGFCDDAGSFVPLQLASWFLFKASPDWRLADLLLVRVFDLSDPDQATTLATLASVQLSLYHLDGNPDPAWDPKTATTCSSLATAPSLCYVNPDGKAFRCSQPQQGGSALRYILEHSLATRMRRLLTLRAVTSVPAGENQPAVQKHYKADPEVIVSPYGG